LNNNIIDRTALNSGTLVYGTGTNQVIFGESAGDSITILADDLDQLYYYSNSLSVFTHDLTVKVIDKDSFGQLAVSAAATITVNRTSASGNLPATVGDSHIKVDNRLTTPITTAMLTTGLNPPYNDPEADALDAIRIDEISTDNQGVFQLNSVDIVEGQIITKADLDANLFTHVGPDVNTIETDAFTFSVRDSGSLQWVS
jgi:hypothetical protein